MWVGKRVCSIKINNSVFKQILFDLKKDKIYKCNRSSRVIV
jgi:hypothetical protein